MATILKEVFLGEFNIGSTDRIQFTVTKDGTPWQGIDSITLTFEKPDRSTRFDRAMVVDDDAEGVWRYDTAVTDIDQVGYWTVRVTVIDGAVVKRYPYEIGFHVSDQP